MKRFISRRTRRVYPNTIDTRTASAAAHAAGMESLETRVLFAGQLDLQFSDDGKQTTGFGWNDAATAVTVDAQQRIIAVGYDDGGAADFALARYLPDGTLDTSFNAVERSTAESGNGRLSFTFGAGSYGGVERATSVAVQSDGKILVAGYTDAGTKGGLDTYDFAVARINPDGTFDKAFSGDGKQTIDFGADDRANAIAVQPGGKIVLAGQWDSGSSDFAIARLNPDGTLDNTFSGDGLASVTFGSGEHGGVDRANAVALTSDGRIVVAGHTDTGGISLNRNNFAVARLTPDGATDYTFSGDGRAVVDFGWDDRATAVAVDRLGRVVLAGFDDGGAADFAVARLEANGDLDPAFNLMDNPTMENGNGRLSFTFGAGPHGGAERASAVALSSGYDQDIYVAGFTDAGITASLGAGGGNFALARVRPDGKLDPGFGDGAGKQVTDFGGDDQAYGAAIQPDGKLVVVGSSNGDFALARYGTSPLVTYFYINSTSWGYDFRSYIDGYGLGNFNFGYAVPAGAGQAPLPWVNLNEITFRFGEAVDLKAADLEVHGVNHSNWALDPAAFIYNANSRTATWRLAAGQRFTADRLTLDLHATRTGGGDGGWGGGFRTELNVLPGDTTRSGTVLADDFSAVKKKFFKSTSSPAYGSDADYSVFHDVDGSGTILASDFSEVKKCFFDSLPVAAYDGAAAMSGAAGNSLFGSNAIRPAAVVRRLDGGRDA